MKFEIIIPNYNGFSLIKENLPKVIEIVKDYNDISITVVDDFSRAEERIELEDFIQKIKEKEKDMNLKLIENPKNLGFSSTIDQAAFGSDAEILYFMNSDVIPKKGFLDPIIKDFSSNEKLFGVGSMDESMEGEEIVFRGRGVGKWRRGFLVHRRGEVDKSNTLWISGGSSAVRRGLFVSLGGFDELYNPFYWEDIDLSYRVQKAGYEILFEKESLVIHKHVKGAIKTNFSDFTINSIAHRNQFIFVWKNITDKKLLISHLLWLPYHKIKALARFDYAFFYGFFLAILKFPDIMIKRKIQLKSFSLGDKEILNRFEKEI